MNNYYVTINGYQKLYQEIIMQDTLHNNIEKEMGISVKRDSDLRENPEYMEFRVKAMYSIPNKKRELLQKYQSAVIIENTEEYINWDRNTIIRMCEVTLDYDGDIETYTILGSNEGDISQNIIACDSPLVTALLGKKINDEIIFNGFKIKILSINMVSQKDVKKR